jgi:hypothetical protein
MAVAVLTVHGHEVGRATSPTIQTKRFAGAESGQAIHGADLRSSNSHSCHSDLILVQKMQVKYDQNHRDHSKHFAIVSFRIAANTSSRSTVDF